MADLLPSRQPAPGLTLPVARPSSGHPISNAALGWSGVAALGFAGLVYFLAHTAKDGLDKTIDLCVGGRADGSSEWMEEVL